MVADVVSTIVDVIQGLLAGIGSAVTTYFEALLIDSATGGLNPFGTFVFVLLGIGAAFGLATLIFNMVRSRA
jgi:hypothetical protein